MTEVAASIWNQIARTQKLQTVAAKFAFRLDQEQLAKMEDYWMFLQDENRAPPRIAVSVQTYLPLLLEHEAISSFLSQHPNFRNALPEVNTAQEAVSLATADYRLTPEEQRLLEKVLTSPRAPSEWKLAAKAAARV